MSSERLGWSILALVLAAASSARATDEVVVVERAARLLEEVSSGPGSGIPPGQLREAVGILILPHIVETRLGMGRRKGHGVFLSRDEKGEWGDPEPFELSGHSMGAEFGRDVTDMVVIYRTRKAAEEFGKPRLTLSLGFDASGVRKHDDRFHRRSGSFGKDTLVYARRRGLLVGVLVSGERQWGPSLAPSDREAVRPGDRKAPGGTDRDRVAVAATAPLARAGRGSRIPEAARLRSVVMAITARPAAPVARAGTKDEEVSPASGAESPAETTASHR